MHSSQSNNTPGQGKDQARPWFDWPKLHKTLEFYERRRRETQKRLALETLKPNFAGWALVKVEPEGKNPYSRATDFFVVPDAIKQLK